MDIPVFNPAIEGDIKLSVVDMTTLGEDVCACFDTVAMGKRMREKEAARVAVWALTGDGAVISHCSDGHPFVDGHPGSLSISHASDLLVAAFSRNHIVGIDIEYPREALRRVVSKFLSESEREKYDELPLLLRAWTIKEAVYKAALEKKLSLFDIILPDPGESVPFAMVRTSTGIRRFRLCYSSIGEALVTLAVRDDA